MKIKIRKFMIWFFAVGVLLFLIFRNHPMVKSLINNYPDKGDALLFDKVQISNGTKAFHFFENQTGIDYGNKLILDDWKNEDAAKKTIRQLAFEHKSNAFILIQNDTILYEEYFRGMTKASFFTSFSVAKSFLSILIGIAIDEGAIKNEHQLVIDFIPELNKEKEMENLKILHLLNHTSGISSNLFTDAYLYYDDEMWKTIRQLTFDKPPGTFQKYQNINAALLGIVLKRATNKSPSKYLEEKIWTKIGMESSAFWSTDKTGIEKTFCCMNALARDFAKFGKLMLQKGNWNGEQIFSEAWYNKSIHRDTSEGSSWAFNKNWYLGLEQYGDFMAIGLYKQFIYVCPLKNVVIVRFGEREKKLHEEKARWARVFREIVDQL